MCREDQMPSSPRSVKNLFRNDGMAGAAPPPLGSSRRPAPSSGATVVIRRKPRGDAGESSLHEADVEAQTPPARQDEKRANGRASPRTAKASSRAPPLVILRKIFHAILTDLDDETLQHPDTEPVLIAITLIKEAIVGLLIAFVVVTVVLFLDHRFLLGLPTARNFRRATLHLLDRDTLRNFEESSGLKLMEVEEYETMIEEIAKSANRTKLAASILEQRSNDLKNYHEDLQQMALALPAAIESLGLDDYCEKCLYDGEGGAACHYMERAVHGTKYQTTDISALLKQAKDASCQRLEDKLLVNGEHNDFCPTCEWQSASDPKKKRRKGQKPRSAVTCESRAFLVGYQNSIPTERARARVMIGARQCRRSVHDEEQRLAGFCQKCMWDEKTTCSERGMELMKNGKGLTVREAILEVVKRPACRMDLKEVP